MFDKMFVPLFDILDMTETSESEIYNPPKIISTASKHHQHNQPDSQIV